MQNIVIGRYAADPQAQGSVQDEEGRWQVVIDKDGFPHFYVRIQIEGGKTGMLCLDDVLPEGMDTRALMCSEFGGELDGDELAAAEREYEARREAVPVPCPR